MKKLNFLLLSILIFTFTYIPAYASTDSVPTANIYKEGIYHFEKGSGNHLIVKLNTPDKPMVVALIEKNNNKLKYYLIFDKSSQKIELFLDTPLEAHTATLVGDGEISFSFTE